MMDDFFCSLYVDKGQLQSFQVSPEPYSDVPSRRPYQGQGQAILTWLGRYHVMKVVFPG